jgi:ferric-dicitrate binding protein FerR (iron transport regulator)
MRPPRYRFPNDVRETARAMASRMVQDGTIARTPEQLDTWISQAPDVRESLESGGYGAEFTSDDLLPLLQVFVAQAGGPPPEAPAPPPSSRRRWLLPLLASVAVAVVLVLLLVATGAIP